MRRRMSIYAISFMLPFLITGCGKSTENREFPSEVFVGSETETENKTDNETASVEEPKSETRRPKESVFQKYSYGIAHSQLDYIAGVTGLDFEKPVGINTIPVMEVYIPGNSEKEDRINRIIAEQCIRLLPMEREWLNTVELQVVYRSERYLCYEYVPRTSLPQEYRNIFFPIYITVDLKEEKAIEYSVDLENTEVSWWYHRLDDVVEIKEQYIKKSVEEQSRLRGETDYEVYQSAWEAENGISFSCVQVKGMKDEEKQSKVNQALREPWVVLAELGDSPKEYLEEKLQGIEMYVSYKSEQWLSVEYSFQVADPWVWEPYGDGILDFGVTVDMQTGKRVMMDDLFEMQGFTEWRCINMGNMNELRLQERVERAIMSEREFIESRCETEESISSVLKNMLSVETFYLYQGKIVMSDAWGDVGI